MKTVALLVVMAIVVGIEAKRTKNFCSEKLCKNNDHTMCIYSGPSNDCQNLGLRGLNKKERQEIVDVHNRLRAKIANGEQDGQPPASNMQKMGYDRELEKVAQRWAEQCKFDHDTCRNVDRFSVGQNAYTIPSKEGSRINLTSAIEYLYSEVNGFDPNNINPFVDDEVSGHYTQIVWAETNLVGCGFTQYDGDTPGYKDSLLICDYGPAGNVVGGTGVMYEEGDAGTDCLPGMTADQDGLCA